MRLIRSKSPAIIRARDLGGVPDVQEVLRRIDRREKEKHFQPRKPPPANVGTWQTVFNQAVAGNAGGFATVSYRIVLAVANLSIPTGTVTAVRVTWKAGTAENFEMLGSGIGPKAGAGDAYDASSITRLLYSGANTGTVVASSTLLSDSASFSWDKATDLVVTFYNNNSAADSAATLTAVTGVQAYSAVTSPTDESQTANATGYGSAAAGRLDLLQKIEMLAG